MLIDYIIGLCRCILCIVFCFKSAILAQHEVKILPAVIHITVGSIIHIARLIIEAYSLSILCKDVVPCVHSPIRVVSIVSSCRLLDEYTRHQFIATYLASLVRIVIELGILTVHARCKTSHHRETTYK